MMKMRLIGLLTVSFVTAGMLALPALADMVITPVSSGAATASGYQNIPPFFDAQPASIPTEGATVDEFGSAGAVYTSSGRGLFLDFGEDWASTTITEVWMGLKLNGTNPVGSPTTFWSNSKDMNFEPGAGDVAAPDFLFGWTGATSAKSWQKVWTGSETAEGQYYLATFDGTQTWSNRPQEFVFVAVPEPATISLLLGALGLVAVRRFRR